MGTKLLFITLLRFIKFKIKCAKNTCYEVTSCQVLFQEINSLFLSLVLTLGTEAEPQTNSPRPWPLCYTWIGYQQVNGPP